MSHHPTDRRSDWLQIFTVTNAAATARTSNPCPPQPFKAASAAFPLLHRNCPLPQTLPQTRVCSIGHFHFSALFLNLSLVKLAKPEQKPPEPWEGPAGSCDAEAKAPETPSSWIHVAAMVPGMGMKATVAKHARKPFWRCWGNKNHPGNQFVNSCFWPPSPKQLWQGHQPQISPVSGISH